MKDIKSYVIGFLTCACLFLIMGQTKADNDDMNMVGIKQSLEMNTSIFICLTLKMGLYITI